MRSHNTYRHRYSTFSPVCHGIELLNVHPMSSHSCTRRAKKGTSLVSTSLLFVLWLGRTAMVDNVYYHCVSAIPFLNQLSLVGGSFSLSENKRFNLIELWPLQMHCLIILPPLYWIYIQSLDAQAVKSIGTTCSAVTPDWIAPRNNNNYMRA